jgi:hypothetical protein
VPALSGGAAGQEKTRPGRASRPGRAKSWDKDLSKYEDLANINNKSPKINHYI